MGRCSTSSGNCWPNWAKIPAERDCSTRPGAWKQSLQFLTSGYQADVNDVLQGAVVPATDREIVIINDVNFYSLCEHHLLPFFGRCHVAYIPTTTAIRPSAIARVVDLFSRRLQVQERLTSQIADVIRDALTPIGVAVVMEATHLCLSMRGAEKQNSLAVTSAMLGAFREDARAQTHLLERLTLRADRSGAPGASNRTCPA